MEWIKVVDRGSNEGEGLSDSEQGLSGGSELSGGKWVTRCVI